MVTVRLPVSAWQVMVNEVDPVPPAGTVAEWEVPPLTLQLPGTPLRVTVWLPAVRPENVTLPLASMV